MSIAWHDEVPVTHANTRRVKLVVAVSPDEIDWLKHAAKLSHESVAEYTRKAINARLVKQGVDAVLLREQS
jgi:uncharacterized protein (DUF1778 family)